LIHRYLPKFSKKVSLHITSRAIPLPHQRAESRIPMIWRRCWLRSHTRATPVTAAAPRPTAAKSPIDGNPRKPSKTHRMPAPDRVVNTPIVLISFVVFIRCPCSSCNGTLVANPSQRQVVACLLGTNKVTRVTAITKKGGGLARVLAQPLLLRVSGRPVYDSP
jgi:hypothetical protein